MKNGGPMPFTQLIPAEGWFVIKVRQADERVPLSVDRLVAWGLTTEGKVVGLIAGTSMDGRECAVIKDASDDPRTRYKHGNELSKQER